MKKILHLVAWISGGVGVVMMILGIIAVFAGGILWNHMWSTYIYPVCSFLMLGIFLFLSMLVCKEKESK